MKLLSAVAFFTAVSTAAGLMCYKCSHKDPQPCTRTVSCDGGIAESCYKLDILGVVTQGCMIPNLCVSSVNCCETDLCNSAPLSLPHVLLLGLCALITLYLNQD